MGHRDMRLAVRTEHWRTRAALSTRALCVRPHTRGGQRDTLLSAVQLTGPGALSQDMAYATHALLSTFQT